LTEQEIGKAGTTYDGENKEGRMIATDNQGPVTLIAVFRLLLPRDTSGSERQPGTISTKRSFSVFFPLAYQDQNSPPHSRYSEAGTSGKTGKINISSVAPAQTTLSCSGQPEITMQAQYVEHHVYTLHNQAPDI